MAIRHILKGFFFFIFLREVRIRMFSKFPSVAVSEGDGSMAPLDYRLNKAATRRKESHTLPIPLGFLC